MNDSSVVLLPFLKWAGGKRWLLKSPHRSVFNLGEDERYVEPFLGGGAVFFGLSPRSALLNDANVELIDTYRAIRDDWPAIVRILARFHRDHDEEHYYRIRASRPRSLAGRAARFIYLNRTCFNGLYRVNLAGEFNVPKGTKTAVIMDSDDFEAISLRLQGVEFSSCDFEVVVDSCGRGDFIYADPPYTVKHNYNGFIKYNEQLFSWFDQERLKSSLERAAQRGARVMVSNADHPSIRELYADWECVRAERHSVMASESVRRKKATELLIFL